jgi:rfaE bifunctional protein nucleotidyltransferase chain/domain
VKVDKGGMARVLTPEAAIALAHALHTAGRTVVWTSGVFDLLHPGHVRFLEQARTFGDALIVNLEADGSVRQGDGRNGAINPDHERAEVVAALASVDVVVIAADQARREILRGVAPDVIVEPERSLDDGEPVGGAGLPDGARRVVRVRVEPGYSTAALAAKIRLGHRRLEDGGPA